MSTRIRPVLLIPLEGESRDDLLSVFGDAMRKVEVFFAETASRWEREGIADPDALRLTIDPPDLEMAPVANLLALDNPYAGVREALVRLGYDLTAGYRVLCWLAGWNSPYTGWSLGNLSVMGDLWYQRSDPDERAWGYAHELSHLLVSPNHRDPGLVPPDLLRPYLVPNGLPQCVLRPEPGRTAGVKPDLTTEPVGCRLELQADGRMLGAAEANAGS